MAYDIDHFVWDVVDRATLKPKSYEEWATTEALMKDTALVILQRNDPSFEYRRDDRFLLPYMESHGFQWVDDPGCWTFAPVDSGIYLRHRDQVVYRLTMKQQDLRWWLRMVAYVGIAMATLALALIMGWDARLQIASTYALPFVVGLGAYLHSATWPDRSDEVLGRINAERRNAGGYDAPCP